MGIYSLYTVIDHLQQVPKWTRLELSSGLEILQMLAQYSELRNIIPRLGMEQLPQEDSNVVSCTGWLESYLKKSVSAT